MVNLGLLIHVGVWNLLRRLHNKLLVFKGINMRFILFLIIVVGVAMDAYSQEPEWVTQIRTELGDEIMSKSAAQLTAGDIFKIVHVTKYINGADDGVWPIVEMNLEGVKKVILDKLKSDKLPADELETIKYLASIFYDEDKEIQQYIEN